MKSRKHLQPRPRDPRKCSVALDAATIEELDAEGERQGRSNSWLAQQAWLIARDRLRQTPAPQRRFRDGTSSS